MSYDTWIHRISRQLVLPLQNTPVTPNHLTTGRLVSGVVAAACFSLDNTAGNIIGAVLFLFSILLDRADGELARIQGSSSRFGAYYDLVTDAIVNICIFLALGIAAQNSWMGNFAIPAGILSGICISAIFILMITTEIRLGHGSAAVPGHAGFDPDDAMIIIPVGVVFGIGDLLLAAAVICTPVAMVIICIDLMGRRKRTQNTERRERS